MFRYANAVNAADRKREYELDRQLFTVEKFS